MEETQNIEYKQAWHEEYPKLKLGDEAFQKS